MKLLKKYGQYDPNLNETAKSLVLRLGLINHTTSAIRFNLSEYGGTLDILEDNPDAMAEFSPRDPDSIYLSEIDEKEDILEKIYRKHRREMSLTRSKKMRQAVHRASEIIQYLLTDQDEIHVVLQSPKFCVSKALNNMISFFKGPKRHSEIILVPNPYEEGAGEDGEEPYARILYSHRFGGFHLKRFLKRIRYSDFGEVYLISGNIIINVYDDRGMDVVASPETIQKLRDKFGLWVGGN